MTPPHAGGFSAEAIGASVVSSLRAAATFKAPYPHWLLKDMLAADVIAALHALPFTPVVLGGESGRREIYNDQRTYVDQSAIATHEVCAALADALQDDAVVGAFAAATGAPLDGTFLRIEFGQDSEGFYLEPHTDLGVKALTLLCSLPTSDAQADLGTDLYAGSDPSSWVKRAAFSAGAGLLFVPSSNTWHGFERRHIPGLRRSLIINYVTSEWRSREQLAFPMRPVHC